MKPPADRRVVEIAWLPRSDAEWSTFSASRQETARLWNTMVGMHANVRRYQWEWPTLKQWQQWAKGRFPAISACEHNHSSNRRHDRSARERT